MTAKKVVSLLEKQAERIHKEAEANLSKAAIKVQLLQDATDALVEANEIYQKAGAATQEGNDKAAVGALALYKAEAEGITSKAETSEILGKVFGFKVSATTGKTSKTPDGQGEAIRKRVVRAVNAFQHVTGNEPVEYFKAVERDSLRAVIERVEDGSLSIWSAYDEMGKLVNEARDENQPLHLSPEKLAKLINKLTDTDTAVVVAKSEGLQHAYAALSAAIAELDKQASMIAAEQGKKTGTNG